MDNGTNISCKNVWFKYFDDWVLRGVDLEIGKGEIVGIVGPNGSGKTTLVKHFNKLLSPDKGKIYYRNENLSGKTTSDVADEIGFVFQNPDSQIFSENVWEEVCFGPENLKCEDINERSKEALEVVGLEDKKEESTGSLSRGEKQRLAIASVLATKPSVLILDEPSAGQDYRIFWKIMSTIVERYLDETKSLVIVSHDMNMIWAFATKIVAMNEGEVIKCSTKKEDGLEKFTEALDAETELENNFKPELVER